MNQTSVGITLNSIKNILPHTHSGLECVLLLKGKLQVEINGDIYHMSPDDIVLINCRDIHSYSAQYNNLAIMLLIEEDFLKNECEEVLNYTFQCNSILQSDSDNLYEMKRHLTRMLLVHMKKEEGSDLEFRALLFRFLVTLMQRFKVTNISQHGKQKQNTASLSHVVDYIHRNYASTVTLADTAKQMYLSPQYFSKYFKNKMGTSFLQYLNQIRLEHAVVSLLGTNQPVIKVALDHGFANAKSFSAAFQKQYGKSPGEYRKLYARPMENKTSCLEEITSDLQDNLLELVKYMKRHDMHHDTALYSPDAIKLDMCKVSHIQLKKPKKMIHIGRMTDILQSEIMEQLMEIQQLAFDFIYFESFDLEEIRIKDDTFYSNYIYNQCMHQIEKLNLSPYVQIDVSRQLERCQGNLNGYMERLSCFLSILRSNTSCQTMEPWRFEIACKDQKHLNSFADFYNSLWNLFKQEGLNVQLGILIPDWALTPGQEQEAFYETLYNLTSQVCFAGFHGYPHPFPEQDNSRTKQQMEDFYVCRVEAIETSFNTHGLPIPPLYMTRWNTLAGTGVAESGTFFRSALIFDTMMKLCGKVEAIGFLISTYHIQEFDGIHDFGILGMFLLKKVKRPVFFVLETFNYVNGGLIFYDNNIVVTKEGEEEFHIVIYSPYYMNPLYSVDLYLIEHEIHQITLILQGLVPGNYRIKRFIFDQGSAGIFNRWSGAGLPDFNDTDVVEYLERVIQPDLYFLEQKVDGECSLHASLTFNGLVLYVVKKQ
ncbi:AraC-type DNA-binding protein [Lacrimispora sphenoides]|jgi:AraC-like DNA-binding protein/beta-xylosidase|uniref:helix-turn-helix domain-containing protein n=1 Tax=Lacrimispora sphenoides TaxID=29370 RepID=UPI0008C13BEA|nr:helix-turn-helix domain-containing protein [Lacrimispora sphenoides]SET69638.1 AraC-type DNA-binding protein [Lacrimispora sphenoides]